MVYKRTAEGEQIMVIINPAAKSFALPLKISGETLYSVGGAPEIRTGNIVVAPESAAFILLK